MKDKIKKSPFLKYFILVVAMLVTLLGGIHFLEEDANSLIGVWMFVPSMFILYYLVYVLLRFIFTKIHNYSTRNHESPSGDIYKTPYFIRYSQDEAEYSWGLCILIIVLIFPVGLFMTLRKAVKEKKDYYYNGARMIILGGFLLIPAIFAWYVLLNIETHTPLDIIGILFGLSPLILVITGIILIHKGKIRDNLLLILTHDKITDIHEIAKLTKTDYAHAVKNIEALNDVAFLEGTYIDHEEGEVIIHGISEKIAVKCDSCGATTVLHSNDERICKYCGAKI